MNKPSLSTDLWTEDTAGTSSWVSSVAGVPASAKRRSIAGHIPSVATSLIWMPCLCDMKPRYVKMTKPEKKLVKLLTAVVTRQSLLADAREAICHSAHVFSKSCQSWTPAARCKLVHQQHLGVVPHFAFNLVVCYVKKQNYTKTKKSRSLLPFLHF